MLSHSPAAIAAPIQAVRKARTRSPAADIGPDDGDERAPEAEDQRDQEVFDARADTVAGDGRRPELADQSGRDRDGDIGADRDQRRDGADAQDLAKQRPAKYRIRAARGGSGSATSTDTTASARLPAA